MTSIVTSKGQVTLPRKFRDYLGVRPGTSVDFSLNPRGEVVVSAVQDDKPRRNKRRFGTLRGSLRTGRSTDELMALLRGYDQDPHDPGFDHRFDDPR